MDEKKKGIGVKRGRKEELLKMNCDEDERILGEDLEIEDLEQACMKLSGIFAWWGVLSCSFKRRADIAKEDLSITEAKVGMKYREQAEKDSKKITEKLLEQQVLTDDDYLEASKNKINSVYEYELSKIAVDALEHKSSMLISLISLKKQELASGITESNKVLVKGANNKISKVKSKKVEDDDDED